MFPPSGILELWIFIYFMKTKNIPQCQINLIYNIKYQLYTILYRDMRMMRM